MCRWSSQPVQRARPRSVAPCAGLCLALLLLGCTVAPPPPPRRDGGGQLDAGLDAQAPIDATPRPRPSAAPRHWFDDVAVSAGVALERPDDFDTLPIRMGGGVCVLDVDGRPPMDLFFSLHPHPGGGSMLYVAAAPVAFEDQTAERGLAGIGAAMGCLAFDADGDGDDDLLVTGVGSVRLFLREGDRFVDRSATLDVPTDPIAMWTSAAAGDVDDDGDIDLLVAGMVRWDVTRLTPGCGDRCGGQVERFQPIANLLLLRNDDGTYTESAAELAPDLTREEMTLAVMITDVDADGRVDLFIGNDFGSIFHNRALARGEDGVYRDISPSLGLGYNARGYGMDTMGLSGADIDGDGRLDYVGTAFAGDASAVFLCADDFCEPQPADRSGTEALEQSFRWGAALVDLDLDGRPDLVEATGHIFSSVTQLGDGELRDQIPNVMWNAGGRFEAVKASAEDGRVRGSMRGIAIADVDEDGRPDIVLAPSVGRPSVLLNVIEPAGAWLRVRLRGRAPNTGGLGAFVTLRAGDVVVGVQERRAGEGYLSSFDPRLFFGVTAPGPLVVEARWPSGAITRLQDVMPNREVELVEP